MQRAHEQDDAIYIDVDNDMEAVNSNDALLSETPCVIQET